MAHIRSHQFRILLILCCVLSTCASILRAQSADQSASVLLKTLLSPHISDDQWRALATQFEQLPPKVALPVLFPEIAQGIPGGHSYAAYNCSDPLRDRKVIGWGEFCIVNWLWCKQLRCLGRRGE